MQGAEPITFDAAAILIVLAAALAPAATCAVVPFTIITRGLASEPLLRRSKPSHRQQGDV